MKSLEHSRFSSKSHLSRHSETSSACSRASREGVARQSSVSGSESKGMTRTISRPAMTPGMTAEEDNERQALNAKEQELKPGDIPDETAD